MHWFSAVVLTCWSKNIWASATRPVAAGAITTDHREATFTSPASKDYNNSLGSELAGDNETKDLNAIKNTDAKTEAQKNRVDVPVNAEEAKTLRKLDEDIKAGNVTEEITDAARHAVEKAEDEKARGRQQLHLTDLKTQPTNSMERDMGIDGSHRNSSAPVEDVTLKRTEPQLEGVKEPISGSKDFGEDAGTATKYYGPATNGFTRGSDQSEILRRSVENLDDFTTGAQTNAQRVHANLGGYKKSVDSLDAPLRDVTKNAGDLSKTIEEEFVGIEKERTAKFADLGIALRAMQNDGA